MRKITGDEVFIEVVSRVNRYLILMGIFFLIYFLFQTQVDIFLFFLALSYMVFALLSHKHLIITNRLSIELQRAKGALGDVTRETREMHSE